MIPAEKAIMSLILGAGVTTTGYGTYRIFKPKYVIDTLDKTDIHLNYEGNKDDETWKTLVTKYKQSSTNPPIKELIMNKENDADHKEGIKLLKAECKKILNTELDSLSAEDLSQKQKDAKGWCLQSSPNINK